MEEVSLLRELQKQSYQFFRHERAPSNGLHYDSSDPGSPQCIASVGMALACAPIAVENHFEKRHDIVQSVLQVLRFLYDSEQSESPTATGYHGFYYHFLDRDDGRRTWKCELSSIDSALLFAGILTAQKYFWRDHSSERELRDLARELYERVDWKWMCNDRNMIAMGWKPETGFLPYYWQGYNEALFLYILALGSPTHPIPADYYAQWYSSYKWKKLYGYDFLYCGPLFVHQMPHCWIDFRGIRDKPMQEHDSDYFENSRRATMIQRAYAERNTAGWKGYCEHCWGISASDGPGCCITEIDGKELRFWDYKARGVPFGPDDGSISPWAAIASLPFAPQEVFQAIRYFEHMNLRDSDSYGYQTTFNLTFRNEDGSYWISRRHIGVNQGPVVMMIENHLTGLIWQLIRDSEPFVRGLQRAGFIGGWLEEKEKSS